MNNIILYILIFLISFNFNKLNASYLDKDDYKKKLLEFMHNQYQPIPKFIQQSSTQDYSNFKEELHAKHSVFIREGTIEDYLDTDREVCGRRTTFKIQYAVLSSASIVTCLDDNLKPFQHNLLITSPHYNIGEVILVEDFENRGHTGQFYIELIYIHSALQGKGLGSPALNRLKDLATFLARHSSFYQTLSLLCADVEHKGAPLPYTPHRLSFYLNHGFKLEPRAQELLSFLSINHMVQRFNEEQIKQYIIDYQLLQPNYLKDSIVTNLLARLKAEYPQQPLDFEQLLQRAEINSPKAAQHILNRALYDGQVEDEVQEANADNTFKMSLDVTQVRKNIAERQSILANRAESSLKIDSLKVKDWHGEALLPDQHELNLKIQQIIKGLLPFSSKKHAPKKRSKAPLIVKKTNFSPLSANKINKRILNKIKKTKP